MYMPRRPNKPRKYDAHMFAERIMGDKRNPFSKEEFCMVSDIVTSMTYTYLAQYHEWLFDQLEEYGKK